VMQKKNTGVVIPEIEWTADVIWQLLTQIKLSENRVVLMGKRKKGKTSKTLGNSKVTVYQHMGAAIFPQLHSLNAVAVGEHVKRKYEHQFGVCTLHYCTWSPNEIVNEFQFFPVLHRILSSRPNVTPIVITTGTGPHGKKTVHFQAPSDDEGDEVGFLTEANCHASSPSFESPFEFPSKSFHDPSQSLYDSDDKENAPPLSQPILTPLGKKPPKALSLSQSSVEKVRHCIFKVPKKRSLDETLMDMQRWAIFC
ncbi:hypothetical protein P692DRAFT_20741130, partial [Suillus brevipes Sb2]